jgi:hypothetical protein
LKMSMCFCTMPMHGKALKHGSPRNHIVSWHAVEHPPLILYTSHIWHTCQQGS